MNMPKSKLFALLGAASICLAAMSPAHAETLDRLLAGQTLTVGNLVFSNFSVPPNQMFNASPQNFDVQGVIQVDPATGVTQSGLRIVIVQQGVPAPFVLAKGRGIDNLVVMIDYTVTGPAPQMHNITQVAYADVVGNAGVAINSVYGTLEEVILQFAPNVGYTNWFGQPVIGSKVDSDLMTATPAGDVAASYVIRSALNMDIRTNKGKKAGTSTAAGWDTLFSE
jgi:hypothetical protein